MDLPDAASGLAGNDARLGRLLNRAFIARMDAHVWAFLYAGLADIVVRAHGAALRIPILRLRDERQGHQESAGDDW